LPESLQQVKLLRELFLVGVSSLQQLPQSIGQLPALQGLKLECCERLAELPSARHRAVVSATVSYSRRLQQSETAAMCDRGAVRSLRKGVAAARVHWAAVSIAGVGSGSMHWSAAAAELHWDVDRAAAFKPVGLQQHAAAPRRHYAAYGLERVEIRPFAHRGRVSLWGRSL
jgi:hypothetical protein